MRDAERLRREALEHAAEAGDERVRANVLYELATGLVATGRLDEARALLDEARALYEKLGDARSRAVTVGKVADILQARGQLDEALRIRKEEELPVYEKLGDVRSLLVGRAKMALNHLARGQEWDREAAAQLLQLAHQDAERLRIPEADQIRDIQKRHGLLPER